MPQAEQQPSGNSPDSLPNEQDAALPQTLAALGDVAYSGTLSEVEQATVGEQEAATNEDGASGIDDDGDAAEQMTRRGFFEGPVLDTAKFVAAASGLVAYVRASAAVGQLVVNRVDQGQQLMSLRQRFRDLLASQQTYEEIAADTQASVSLPYIDLRHFVPDGAIILHIAEIGPSTSYLAGTMSDGTGPFNQSHSILQINYEMIDANGLAQVHVVRVKVGTWSIPGAPSPAIYSNDPNPQPRELGMLGREQAESPELRKHLARSGPNVLGQFVVDGSAMNNVREIITSASSFAGKVRGITAAMMSNDHAARDAQQQYEALINQVAVVGEGWQSDLVALGDKAADLYHENLANGGNGVVMSVNGAWPIRGARAPIGFVDESQNTSPLLNGWFVRDLVDIHFLNRWCFVMSSLPDGLAYDFAELYWKTMRVNQNMGMRRIRERHPDLPTSAPEQMDVNQNPAQFYPITRQDGVRFEVGDGHAGDEGVYAAGKPMLDGIVGGESGGEAVPMSALQRGPKNPRIR